MKKILAIVFLLSSFCSAQVIRAIAPTGKTFDIARNVAWDLTTAPLVYVVTVPTTDTGMCVSVYSNSSASNPAGAIFQAKGTSDKNQTNPLLPGTSTFDSGRWRDVMGSGLGGSIDLTALTPSSGSLFLVSTGGNVKVAIVLTGFVGTGTYNITATMTSDKCGLSRTQEVTESVRGSVQAGGAISIDNNNNYPVMISGITQSSSNPNANNGALQILNLSSSGDLTGNKAAFQCLVAVSTATTIQAIGGSCAAPGANLSLYITDIVFGTSAAAGTAADSFPTLKSGTGGTCGANTAVVFQALTTANSTIVANYSSPKKISTNNELCWIMSTAGSKTIEIRGFIAP